MPASSLPGSSWGRSRSQSAAASAYRSPAEGLAAAEEQGQHVVGFEAQRLADQFARAGVEAIVLLHQQLGHFGQQFGAPLQTCSDAGLYARSASSQRPWICRSARAWPSLRDCRGSAPVSSPAWRRSCSMSAAARWACAAGQHRSRSAQISGIQGDREQRQQDGDRDAAACGCAVGDHNFGGGGVVEQLALQLLPRLGEVGSRQRAVAVVALQFGKAVAMDGGIERGQRVGADDTAPGATTDATAAPGRRRPASPLQDKNRS
jgi:hypothetical protein